MGENIFLDRKTKNYYLELFKIDDEILKLALPNNRGKKVLEEKQYTLYKGNLYGRFCNSFMECLTLNLTTSYPEFFSPMINKLILSQINVLSKTYISIKLF